MKIYIHIYIVNICVYQKETREKDFEYEDEEINPFAQMDHISEGGKEGKERKKKRKNERKSRAEEER